MNLDTIRWSGEGVFTQTLIDAFQRLDQVVRLLDRLVVYNQVHTLRDRHYFSFYSEGSVDILLQGSLEAVLGLLAFAEGSI